MLGVLEVVERFEGSVCTASEGITRPAPALPTAVELILGEDRTALRGSLADWAQLPSLRRQQLCGLVHNLASTLKIAARKPSSSRSNVRCAEPRRERPRTGA